MESKIYKLREHLNKIYDLANNDLMIVDRDTGANVYDMNYEFATKLDDIAKDLIGLSEQCSQKAEDVRVRVDAAKDKKMDMQEMLVITESQGKKDQEEYDIIQREHYAIWVDTDSEDDDVQLPGDMDTKFKYTKRNNNDGTSYICNDCEEVYRNKRELRNHLSNHHKELYRCLRCSVVCRSERSFYNHNQTHSGTLYDCPDRSCGQTFTLKTSLTNHLQKHSGVTHKCKKCLKTFIYRQSFLEHIKYRHLKNKTIECPICHKFYWTPTAMRSHRARKHGLVTELNSVPI